ncbi:MAG: ATP-dependent helicase, partial [Fusobacteriaceae bacterium]
MLNSSQKEVVQHTEGPLMVIAGPGTGKTFTLVKKVIYLLTEKKISPESIFITTFTRKAVNELRLRIAEEIKNQNLKIDSNRIKISTFHSFCIEVLEKEKFNILDELEQRYFIYKNMGHFENVEGFNLLMSSLATNFQPRALLIQKQFNKLSEHNIDSESLISSTNKSVAVLGLVYDKYLTLLKDNNFLDFSTIQSATLNLLEKKPGVIEKLVNQFKYILVDEYQDTNTIQNQILFILFSKVKNICVVGDDDQSIYRFRGATVRNILNFPHKFSHEKFKTVKLEVNFRSNSEIIDFYSKFMNKYNWENKRYYKQIVSATNEIHHPTVAKIIGVTSEQWETSLVNSIKDLKEKNIISDYSHIVFLAQSVKSPDVLSLIKRMNENGIPTYSPRSGNFFKKEEIKTVLGIALSLYKEYTRNNIYNTRDYSNFETYTYYKECINLLKNGSDCIFKDMIPSLKDMNFNCDTKFLDILYKFFSFEYFKNIFSKSNLEDKAYEIIENNLSIISNIIFKYEEKNGSIFKADFFDFYLPFLKECGINEYENEREVSIKNHISF